VISDIKKKKKTMSTQTQQIQEQVNYKMQRMKQKQQKPRGIGRWYIGETLGKGGYSWVKKGYDKKTSKCVALKFMAKADESWIEEQQKQVCTEIEALKKIRHTNVLKLYAYNVNAKYPTRERKKIECVLLVLEYAPGGELFDILYYTSALEPTIARTYFVQFINGLEACHKLGICHRDLKPQNLLLDNKFNLKICDFGLSKIHEIGNNTENENIKNKNENGVIMDTHYVGTSGYQAPELLSKKKYDYSCDIFSAGVVLFILINGYPPFEEGKKSDKWYRPLYKGDNAKFWKQHKGCNVSTDEYCKDLLQRMLAYNPEKRIKISEIKQHPWFNDKIIEGSDLISILKKRHRFMESKRRKDAKKISDLHHSITKKRNIPGFGYHNEDEIIASIPNFPENEIEGIYDVYTTANYKDIFNYIYDTIGECNGDSTMNISNMILTSTLKVDNTTNNFKNIIRFETQIFLSNIFKNCNEFNNEKIYVIRFKRIEGNVLNYKNILHNLIYKNCSTVLTGLPKWARNYLKNEENKNKNNNNNDEEDEYDKLLNEEPFDTNTEIIVEN